MTIEDLDQEIKDLEVRLEELYSEHADLERGDS